MIAVSVNQKNDIPIIQQIGNEVSAYAGRIFSKPTNASTDLFESVNNLLDTYEENKHLKEMVHKKEFMEIYSLLSSMISLKRPHEFAIVELALHYESFELNDALKAVKHSCQGDQMDATLHALEIFQHHYADRKEKEKIQLIRKENDIYYFHPKLIKVLEDSESKMFIEDILHYGLLRYQIEFGRKDYGYPFLNIYTEYSQREVGLMTNYRNTLSSFRGSTLTNKKNGDHFFLFIDLHKEEEIEKSINYKDKFISRSQFQWESPNSTKSTSIRGEDLTLNVKKEKTIHLFVRKYKEVNKVTQRYTYIGTADSISFQNEKPIEIQYQLHQKMPLEMYEEFEPEKITF